MTWEETISMINKDPNYADLVRDAYISTDLVANIEHFKKSPEFIETLSLIKKYAPGGKKILDIGCGNGISAISFALNGYEVTALEPDPSQLVGYGAIEKMANYYNLSNLKIEKCFAEDFSGKEKDFDIVYARQSMHHAANLNEFVKNTTKNLKKGGLWISVRDHVVFDEKDKEIFLQNHPLQKYYGGENAFAPFEYRDALANAGLKLINELKYYDSVINFFPLTECEVIEKKNAVTTLRQKSLGKKIGFLSKIRLIYRIYNKRLDKKLGNGLDEKQVPGRMYTYIALKK